MWLPIGTDPDAVGLLHLALKGRFAGANNGQLQYKSKPESFFAQANVLDTGKFDASATTIGGVEAYYESGPLSAGLDYYANGSNRIPPTIRSFTAARSSPRTCSRVRRTHTKPSPAYLKTSRQAHLLRWRVGGLLDRMDRTGGMHLFQTRVQLQFK